MRMPEGTEGWRHGDGVQLSEKRAWWETEEAECVEFISCLDGLGSYKGIGDSQASLYSQ